MSEKSANDLARTLREQGARYVVGATGQPVAVLLTLEEYDHYLDLLDNEADSQDAERVARLHQAAARATDAERLSFRDSLNQRRRPQSTALSSWTTKLAGNQTSA